MTRGEEMAAVVRLACLVDHRSDAEQRALIAVAWRCDVEHNQNTTANRARRQPGFALQDLVGEALDSREMGDGDRTVRAPEGRERRWQVWQSEMLSPADTSG